MCLQWKEAYEKIQWRGNSSVISDKVIVDTPDFKPYWDTAFEAWKDYIISK